MKALYKIIILIAVLAFLYFFYTVDLKKETVKERMQEETKTLVKYNPDDVAAVRLNNGKDLIYVEKDDNDIWQMKEPLVDRAEASVIYGILDKIAEIKAVKKIKPKDGDFSHYGLNKPESGFVFYDKELKSLLSVDIGEESVVTNVVYIRIDNGDDVFLVNPEFKKVLSRSVYEMRNKKLLDLSPNNVEKITITSKNQRFTLEKREGLWSVTYPINCKADNNRIYSYIDLLNKLVIKKFVLEETKKEDMKKYGLDTPDITFNFICNDGKTKDVFLNESEDHKNMYVRSNEKKGIYLVEDNIIPKLPDELIDLRPTKIMPFNYDDIEKFELKNTRGEISFTKDINGFWTGSVSGEIKSVDTYKVRILANIVAKTRALKIIDVVLSDLPAYGFNSPLAEITCFGKDNKKLGKMIFGKHDAEGIKIYCKNEDVSEVAVIDSLLFRDFVGRETDFFIM